MRVIIMLTLTHSLLVAVKAVPSKLVNIRCAVGKGIVNTL